MLFGKIRKTAEIKQTRAHSGLVDFHSHMLPHMDDGSSSVEESIRMIDSSVRQGVSTIVLTPHFYASENSPSEFLERREHALEELQDAVSGIPVELIPGAEVTYFDGLSGLEQLSDLMITGTSLLLVEMPFWHWSGRMLDDLLSLNERTGCQVVLAHIERYLSFQPKSTLDMFLSNGFLIQANAEYFLDRHTKKEALRTLAEGKIHLLGTDAHHSETRRPNLGEACDIIDEKCGEAMTDDLMRRASRLLHPAPAADLNALLDL